MTTCAPWADLSDVCAPCDDYAFDPAVLTLWLQVASDVLYSFTNYRWPGVCTEFGVRPCAQRSHLDTGPPSRRASLQALGSWSPGMVNGRPWGFCGCGVDDGCGCSRLPSIRLGGAPIVDVLQVKVDGAVLDSSSYRVDNYDVLVRLPSDDGVNDGWPCCQRLDLADTEVDTMSVDYSYGAEPPPGGIASAAALGCQLALAATPSHAAHCRLPKRVTSMTRQNVTIAVLDPWELFPRGYTGLPEVDLWLASVRHGDAHAPALVVNPETAARRVRRTNT